MELYNENRADGDTWNEMTMFNNVDLDRRDDGNVNDLSDPFNVYDNHCPVEAPWP